MTERVEARLRAVLAYVRRHPRCTARDVARDVLHGTGATRTPARSAAYGALVELERRSEVVRACSENTHRWLVDESETSADAFRRNEMYLAHSRDGSECEEPTR
jgi:hypothetical protein